MLSGNEVHAGRVRGEASVRARSGESCSRPSSGCRSTSRKAGRTSGAARLKTTVRPGAPRSSLLIVSIPVRAVQLQPREADRPSSRRSGRSARRPTGSVSSSNRDTVGAMRGGSTAVQGRPTPPLRKVCRERSHRRALLRPAISARRGTSPARSRCTRRGETAPHSDLLATEVIACSSGSMKSSGKLMHRAASRTVIGRCSVGCR